MVRNLLWLSIILMRKKKTLSRNGISETKSSPPLRGICRKTVQLTSSAENQPKKTMHLFFLGWQSKSSLRGIQRAQKLVCIREGKAISSLQLFMTPSHKRILKPFSFSTQEEPFVIQYLLKDTLSLTHCSHWSSCRTLHSLVLPITWTHFSSVSHVFSSPVTQRELHYSEDIGSHILWFCGSVSVFQL